MRGALAAFLLAALFSGCASLPGPDGSEPPQGANAGVALAATYYLKSGYRLDEAPPTGSNPAPVASNPVANGFVNEDLHAFTSLPLARGVNVSWAHLTVFYEADGPTVDAFPNSTGPQESRHFVFWLGSESVYPIIGTAYGPTVLLPDRVYRADVLLPVPAGGWTVPAGERVQLLAATLATNAPQYDVRFLVDSTTTPSRLELRGNASGLAVPSNVASTRSEHTIEGNAGLFTGATAERVPSSVQVPVPEGTDYLEVRVRFVANAGGKSDLDFVLQAPTGEAAAVSTTPYQNETVRMFAPNLNAFGSDAYVARVDAYSGANTRLTVEIRTASRMA